MADETLFEGLDPVTLDAVTSVIGHALMGGARPTLEQLAHDDTIQPRYLAAAMCRAHLLGAASLMIQVSKGEDGDGEIVKDATAFLTARLAELRAMDAEGEAFARACASHFGGNVVPFVHRRNRPSRNDS